MYRIRIRSRHARLSGGLMLSATVVAMMSANAAYAAPTVLDFEDLPAGTTVTAQYAARGVIFQSAYLDTDPAAHSGTRVLRTVAPTAEIFTAVPLVMTFTSPQALVSLFAGSPLVALNGTLTAFDGSNNVVAQDGPRLVAADVFTTAFQVTVATPSIMRAELQLEGSAHQAIDDLTFDGQPPAQVPTTPPVVTITSPVNGADLDVNSINITGTVTGDGLLSPVKLTVQWLRPPEESTAPPFTSDLDLTGTGTTRQFSLPGGFTNVPLGPITVTVAAQNTGALTGTGTSTFTNLPGGIRDRFQAQGGAAAMGAFRFGLFPAGCKIAVYENGAISDAKLLISGDIFTKWLSLKGPSNQTGFFGCPLEDAGSGPGGSRVQSFTGGRIYSNLPVGTAYVPAVFVDAISKRGGEAATGVPIADPVMPVEPVTQTWLFQQFARPDRPDLLDSTLEIRGTPPTLWMEREGGDLSLPVEPLAAIWENFPCSGNQGPCTVDAPQPDGTPIQNAGDMFCGGVSISDEGKVGVVSNGPRREWQPILLNDYISTPLFGVIKKSFFAGEDFFASHEWFYDCPALPDPTKKFSCPSDWNVDVIPIGLQARVAPYQSIFAAGNVNNGGVVELEYERFYGDFEVWMGLPAPGELFYGAGRWIIDCGHDDFASELHPLYMYAKMKTVTTLTDPFTGLVNNNPFGGQPATEVDIWVNGWYPGGDDADHAIEFDIFPPPRPTPTATLVVNKPADADAVAGVDLVYGMAPGEAPSHVHVKFTAPYRENVVTVWGEVKWEINRGYEGQWYLYWAP